MAEVCTGLFEGYFDHRLVHSWSCVWGIYEYDCPISSCEMAREADLGSMRVLFRYHCAMVELDKLLHPLADGQSEETAEDSPTR